MWEPLRLTILLAYTACYKDSFTFIFIRIGLEVRCRLRRESHGFETSRMQCRFCRMSPLYSASNEDSLCVFETPWLGSPVKLLCWSSPSYHLSCLPVNRMEISHTGPPITTQIPIFILVNLAEAKMVNNHSWGYKPQRRFFFLSLPSSLNPKQYFPYFNILHPVVCNYYTSNSEGRQHNK
jgi:hypothetical protein